MTLPRSLLLVPLVALALAGCAGGGDDGPTAASSGATAENPMAPSDEPLGLEPTSPEGEVVTPVAGLSLTLPEGTVEDGSSTADGVTTSVYRLPDRDPVTGLPAIQVQGGSSFGRDIEAETHTQQQLVVGSGTSSDVHRSYEEWPGAAAAVAMTWTQEVQTDSGEPHANDVVSLWLVDEQGRGYTVMATGAEGEIEPGSPAYDALLSATLE